MRWGGPSPKAVRNRSQIALCAHFESLGGTVKTASRVEKLSDLPKADLTMCDLTPRQLLKVAGERLTTGYSRRLQRWKYGPGVFKVDYALSEPIPWKATECLRAGTVHIGGTFAEIAASEDAMRQRTKRRATVRSPGTADVV